jgi:hypothetical protein
MPIRKRFGFPGKEETYGQVTYAEVVVIHHDVLKSTTSAGVLRDMRDMQEKRDSKFWSEIPNLELPTSNFRAARLSRQSRSSCSDF